MKRRRTSFEVFEQRADGSEIPRGACGHRHRMLRGALRCCESKRCWGGYWVIREVWTADTIEEAEAKRIVWTST